MTCPSKDPEQREQQRFGRSESLLREVRILAHLVGRSAADERLLDYMIRDPELKLCLKGFSASCEDAQ
jgi:hypothetical protein